MKNNNKCRINAVIVLVSGFLPFSAAISEEAPGLGESQELSFRDPFTPSALMYQQAGSLANLGTDAFGFRPGEIPDVEVPRMRLRGLLTEKGTGNELALLEVVGSGVYMVREGDEININPRQPASAIRITEISRLSITIETGTLGRIRVLR